MAWEVLEQLQGLYEGNWKAQGVLSSLEHSLASTPQLPPALLEQIEDILFLSTDLKWDIAIIWSELGELTRELAESKTELADTAARLQASEEQLAIRQMFFALNEKLLRKVAAVMGISPDQLWRDRIHNIGKLSAHRYQLPWQQIQTELGFADTPQELWEDICSGRADLDQCVHDGSFKHLSDSELLAAADSIFVGEREKFKPTFVFEMRLSRKLSGDTGSLYTYE